MEKILKALDRAQQEGGRTAERVHAGPGARVSVAEEAIANAIGSPPREGGPEPLRPKPKAVARSRVERVSVEHLVANRLIAAQSRNEANDVFRLLRTRVLKRLDENQFNSLMLVSSAPGEGKSLLAGNLALSIAKLTTRSVLLVDTDLRRPSVHELFGVKGTPGLVDYLVERTPLETCLVNPGIERLVLLPAGGATDTSSELLASERMLALAREVQTRYPDRIVIYDAPPLLCSDDAVKISQYVDCGLLVASEGLTRQADLERGLALLEGFPLIGTVLNNSTEPTRSYYSA